MDGDSGGFKRLHESIDGGFIHVWAPTPVSRCAASATKAASWSTPTTAPTSRSSRYRAGRGLLALRHTPALFGSDPPSAALRYRLLKGRPEDNDNDLRLARAAPTLRPASRVLVGPRQKLGPSIVLYVIAGVPILTVFVLAVVFRSIPVLMVLVLEHPRWHRWRPVRSSVISKPALRRGPSPRPQEPLSVCSPRWA